MSSAFIVLASCMLLQFSQAQHHAVRFEHFGTGQGLSQNSALALYQDSRGFLWIGTQNGLNRFDGYSFTQYHHSPFDSLGISTSYITGVTGDKLGRLWITGLGGSLDVFSHERGTFSRLNLSNLFNGSTVGQRTVLALSDSRGGIWLMSGDERLAYLPPELIHLPPQQLLDSAVFSQHPVTDEDAASIYEDSQGNIWVGTMNSIVRVAYQTRPVPGIVVKDVLETGAPVMAFNELSTQPGYIWVATLAGLRFIDIERRALVQPKGRIPANEVLLREGTLTFAEVSPGVMWVGTTAAGLFEVDTRTGEVAQFQHVPTDPLSLGDNRVTAILKDRTGTLWLGSITSGLTKAVQPSHPFRFVGYNPDDKRGLRDYDVTALLVDSRQTLWVGTRKGGLHRSNLADSDAMRFYRYPVGRGTHSLPDPYVKAIHEDRRGNLWVGIWALSGGLLRADATRRDFIHFEHDPSDPSSLASNLVRAIKDDVNGYLWVGSTGGGLSRIHLDSLDAKIFRNYKPDPADSTSLSMNDVFSVLISKHVPGEVWAGTFEKGLNKLDRSTGTFTRYRFSAQNPTSLCDDRISSLYEDRAGNIWVATFSGLSLLRHDKRPSGIFECFTERDGLINNLIQGILEDKNGNIWLSTQKGLSRFNPATRTFSNFYSRTHLPINELNTNALCADGRGRLYFGGVNGFFHFDPDSIRINTAPPPIAITSFRIFEQEAELDTPVSWKGEVRLSHTQNFLSFEFAALDFRDPQRNLYAYKMDGLNNDWVHIGNRRYAAFSNLPPGEYVFRVKAANNDAVWNEEVKSLRIVIVPPFWMTAGFRIIAGVLLLGAIIITVRYISTLGLRKRLRELEVREKIQEERERISSELHDNIGSNLTNLATGLEVSRRYVSTQKLDELQDNLGFLEGSARTTIQSLRETIWSLQPESGTAASLARRIEDYLDERTRFLEFPIVHKTLAADETFVLTPSQALNIYRICQEAINNALKHSGAKTLSVKLESCPSRLLLVIEDDGCGYDPATASKSMGYGIENMKRRATKIGAQVEMSSATGGGTILRVHFQPSQNTSSPE